MPTTDWNPLLRAEFEKPYWHELQKFVETERNVGTVYPPEHEVFQALHLCSYSKLRVVLLGQDPYHGEGQAHGLCFSVKEPVPPPPSLRNIYKELQSDLGHPIPNHGSLISWAAQGVLLLNTTLTVRAGVAASHQKKGWEIFTDRVIQKTNEKNEPIVYILWGASARKKKKLIDLEKHHIIESPHPSPLSAHRGFFGSKPFSKTNQLLEAAGQKPISWEL